MASYGSFVDGQVFHRALKHVEQSAVVVSNAILVSSVIVHVKVTDGVPRSIQFFEGFAFCVNRYPRVGCVALHIQIGCQHDACTFFRVD